MTYAINPNAKNVWIRDNEDTMDLSPITDASSVYLENGRTIEQELGEGSMVSNVATVDTSMSKIIDDTLDGAYESCLLKGRTLVNVLGSCKFSLAKTEEGKSVTRYIPLNPLIKPNTKYLYVINVLKNTLTRSDNGSAMKYCETDSSKVSSSTCWGWMNHIYPGFTGVKKHIMTTKPVFEGVCELSDRIEIYGSTDVGGVIEFETFVIEYQEGMENWDIPYFEGLCDVKMPILRNVGKNLFDIDSYYEKVKHINGVTRTEEGIKLDCSINDNVANKVSPYKFATNFKPRTSYTISTTRVNEGNFNGKLYISYTDGTGISVQDASYTTPSNKSIKLIELTWNTQTGGGKTEFKNIQIEESPTLTTFEPYKTNILHTPEEIVLRSLPNGVKDTYNVITGEYVKRIGEVVLDGGESFDVSIDELVYSSGYEINKTSTYFKINPTSFVAKSPAFDEAPNILSFPFATLSRMTSQRTTANSICLYHDGFGIRIDNSNLTEISNNGFRQYLSQNPITVYYELAEPITTTVDPIGVPFAYENGHVILESGYNGQSLLPTLEYSTVVNKTGQVQSVAKTIMKQEEQLSSLEKMLTQSIVEMDYNNTLLTLNLEIDEVM